MSMDTLTVRAWAGAEAPEEGHWMDVELGEKAVRRLVADPDLAPQLRICAEAFLACLEG